MVQGRKPNVERRQRMAELRAQGLSFAEIGRRLGVTGQTVRTTLYRRAALQIPAVPCSACGRDIASAGVLPDDHGAALCLTCLGRCPEATFSQRLRSLRLAAGLTRAELARRAGVAATTITDLEQRPRRPHWTTIACLVAVLGPGLVPPEQPNGKA